MDKADFLKKWFWQARLTFFAVLVPWNNCKMSIVKHVLLSAVIKHVQRSCCSGAAVGEAVDKRCHGSLADVVAAL